MGASQGTVWIVVLICYFFTLSLLNIVVGSTLVSASIDNPVLGSQSANFTEFANTRDFASEYNVTGEDSGFLARLTSGTIFAGSGLSSVLDIIKLTSGFYIYLALPFPLNIVFGMLFVFLPSLLMVMAIYNLFPTVN